MNITVLGPYYCRRLINNGFHQYLGIAEVRLDITNSHMGFHTWDYEGK